MKIHDVTLTMTPGMTTWSGEPGPEITPLRRIAKGDSANVSKVCFGDHTGTHVDPPVHFIEGGGTVEALPLDALVGPCVVLEFPGAGNIDGEWLSRQETGGAERILFRTRNSELWRDIAHPFTRDFAALRASGARWCVDHGVKLVGVDYLSIEPQGPEKEGYPTHRTLLEKGVVVVEGLDLRGIRPGGYELVCAPIKIADGDGAPARVFLLER